MKKNPWWARLLRILGIVLMGITAAFTIMSGIGTSCAAFAAERFGASMAPIAPYSWLYIIFVIVTTAIGVMGARATVLLVRGRANAYRHAVIALILGIAIGVIHMVASRAIRGRSMPTDAVVYITVLTLILFIIFRIPAVWKEVNYDRSGRDSADLKPAAITLGLCGLAVLTAPLWGKPSHVFIPGGFNWANAWPVTMNLIGAGMLLCGAGMLAAPALKKVYCSSKQLWSGNRYSSCS